jgi:hypothetical protein
MVLCFFPFFLLVELIQVFAPLLFVAVCLFICLLLVVLEVSLGCCFVVGFCLLLPRVWYKYRTGEKLV